ncbi:ABC transporter ATP-binding protein [Cardinium endosymbiont of Culicoides punctatus]|uniref:ABC transporter ATP-binding protein n=1 Tax=Cardinium endosymbiont of Culicoides punctatus TaxID=2304601 RepID=UPI0010590931|nr:ABC transporter ATP-binding protein [Cardinium endosymbiont of Culicoides punctatus]TDG95634.1 putative multidrug export ATP-binding/permease protein [Cardinium endosymbiont of Culicoides punctatus]
MFKTIGLPRTLFSFILFFVKKQRANFSLMFFTLIFWSINESLYPYFIKVLVSTIEQLTPGLTSPFRVMIFPLMGLIIPWLLMEIAMRGYGIIAMRTWPKFRKNIRETILDYTQNHSHSYFLENFSGGISNKIAELPRACEHILEIVLGSFFCSVLTFCISLVIVFQVSAIFGIILFVFVAIFVLVTTLSMNSINTTAKAHADTISTLDGQIVDSLSSMLAVRLFSRSGYELTHIGRYQTDEIEKSEKASWAIEKANIFRGGLTFIFIIITFLTLIYGWNQRWISIGDFSLINMTFFNLMGLVWHSSFHITQIAKEVGVSKAALSLISMPHSIQNHPQAKSLCITKGTISFDKVTFGYIPSVQIFDQISVTIEGGGKIGLVGLSGSGKTTFVNLILRLYDIQNGIISIDNQNITNISQESLHEQIAMIPQDPQLFHRTIFENIHYGRLDATKEQVLEAASIANCTEFINNLHNGFESIVGERGAKLSGGQRQRIAIARAILKNAPILIMDEATSALDSETEKIIQTSLRALMKDCTAIVVAHRLSTISHMDRILVFHKGRIIEDGNMSELLAQKGYFARLWEMQSNGFLPDKA